jgi:hypothetical protein
MPTEIPQLDNIFVQAVSEDLRKKLIRHLGLAPAETSNEHIHYFNNLLLLAIDVEEELRTMTNIAERAAFFQTCPYGPCEEHNSITREPDLERVWHDRCRIP